MSAPAASTALLHRHRFREVARLVDVAVAPDGDVAGEQLQRHDRGVRSRYNVIVQIYTPSAGIGTTAGGHDSLSSAARSLHAYTNGEVSLDEPLTGDLRLVFPDLALDVSAPLSHWALDESAGTLVLHAAADEDVILRVTLHGAIQPESVFAVHETYLELETPRLGPRSELVAMSLTAAIALAERVHLQTAGGLIPFRIAEPPRPREISRWLRTAEHARWLLVIGRATGLDLPLPHEIPGQEIESIERVYRAIAERRVEAPVTELRVTRPLSPELCRALANTTPGSASRHVSPGPRQIETVLGHPIDLGEATIVVEEGVLANLDDLKRIASTDPTASATFVVEPVRGVVHLEFPDAPGSSSEPWGEPVDALLAVRDELDRRLAARYHALASATLPTDPADRPAFTERADLDDDASWPYDESEGIG